MTISKMIYLVNILSNLKYFVIAVLSVLSALIFFIILNSFIDISIAERNKDVDKRKEVKNTFIKQIKKIALPFIIAFTIFCLIPGKQEMYIMALTKDYTTEDVYKMTKEELKSGIDYMVDQLKTVNNIKD